MLIDLRVKTYTDKYMTQREPGFRFEAGELGHTEIFLQEEHIGRKVKGLKGGIHFWRRLGGWPLYLTHTEALLWCGRIGLSKKGIVSMTMPVILTCLNNGILVAKTESGFKIGDCPLFMFPNLTDPILSGKYRDEDYIEALIDAGYAVLDNSPIPMCL
jgi:hypothetical protein